MKTKGKLYPFWTRLNVDIAIRSNLHLRTGMPARSSPLPLRMNFPFVPKLLKQQEHLAARKRRQDLFKLFYRCTRTFGVFDVLQQERFVRFTVQTFLPCVGTSLPQVSV